MKKLIHGMDKVLTFIEEPFLAITLAFMLLINVGNVVSRFVLHQSWSTTEELSRYLFVASTLVGAAVAAKTGSNLTLSLLTDYLGRVGGPRVARILVLIRSAAMFLLFSLLLYLGWGLTAQLLRFGQMSPALGIPRWIPALALPFGAIVVLLRVIHFTYQEWHRVGEN